jgi:hypothetical protein
MKTLRTICLCLALLISGFMLTSCGGISELPYESLSKQTIAAQNQDINPRISIVQSPSAVYGLLPEDQAAIQSVDYSRNIVFVVFLGYGTSSQPWITEVQQLKALTGNLTVWIESGIPATSDNTSINYEVIKVEKSQIARHRGNILFRLLGNALDTKGTAILARGQN